MAIKELREATSPKANKEILDVSFHVCFVKLSVVCDFSSVTTKGISGFWVGRNILHPKLNSLSKVLGFEAQSVECFCVSYEPCAHRCNTAGVAPMERSGPYIYSQFCFLYSHV